MNSLHPSDLHTGDDFEEILIGSGADVWSSGSSGDVNPRHHRRRRGCDVGDVVMGGGWNLRDLVGSGGFIVAAGGDGDLGSMNAENLVTSGGGVVLGGGRGVAIQKF
ncbi:hypothetical protein Tco_0824521 [Tanacetum coccineum]|uniref:Uncharacterized protein n=1 Tax=Tanacetum coccineum TaxID=301880 RepID=A0ABQ5ANZ7_9ASTR